MANRTSKWLHRTVQCGLASAIAIVGLVAFDTPAFAHDNVITSTPSCASPLGTGYTITWNIANDYNLAETGTVVSVTGGLNTLNTTTFNIAASPGTPYQSTNITQTLPASASGTITLDTSAKWSDGFTTSDSGTANLSTLNCAAPKGTLAGHIYLCNNSNPTTSEVTGGTLAANSTPAIGPVPNPLAQTSVAAGTVTMTATAPPNTKLVVCGGSSQPNASGSSATESVTVPNGGPPAIGVFYAAQSPGPGTGENFTCAGNVVYNTSTNSADGGTTSGINTVDPTTGVESVITDSYPGVVEPNGLGISQDGTESIYIDEQHAGNVFVYNPITEKTTEYSDGDSSAGVDVAGGVDPANGIYYFANYNNGTATIYGFNLSTLTAIPGVIATAPLAVGGGAANGDLSFDELGDMYLIDSVGSVGGIARVSGPLPTTATGAALKSTTLTTSLPGASTTNGFNGIAFLGDGDLVVQRVNANDQSALYVVDPDSGKVVSGPTTELGIDTDLGTCSYNPTLVLQKNVVNRLLPSDQFNLAVTGSGITDGNTATTSGSATGIQSAQVGPLIGVSGNTYTMTETGAGSTSLSDYSSTYSCKNSVTGSIVTSGTGTTFNYMFPAPVQGQSAPNDTCVFTNTPLALLSVAKALGSPRYGANDQFTVAIHTGSASGPVVNNTSNSTTTGSGSTVTSGTGITGSYLSTPGTTYYLTEAGANGTSLTPYTPTITCTDANHIQTGLPSNAPFSGSLAVTPVAGANISCVITNTVIPKPALTIVKSASPATVSKVGATITYTFVVTNSGNVPLTDVHVTDTQLAPAGALASGPTCVSLSNPSGTCSGSSASLAVGQVATFTATYLVTQADLNNGSINDSATATGTPPSGPPVTSPPSTATVGVTSQPALTIVKSASPATVSKVGAKVTYTFVVTNTGNVTLTDVNVADTQDAPAGALASGPTCVSLASPSGTCSGSSTTLLVGQVATFTATYLVTQADLNSGSINDSATATGTPPHGPPVTSPPSSATVGVTSQPSLTIVKSASPATVSKVGAKVTYTFVVTNTGNVTLTDVHVNDTQDAPAGTLATGPTCVSLASPSGTCSGSSTTLAVGQVATFTATYLVTQADLNNGSINDSATATGTPPSGSPVTSPPSTATVGVTSKPALTIVKSASPATVSKVGATVTYTFVVTNTGNVTLTDVSVTDTQDAPAGALATLPDCQSLSSPTGTCAGATTTLLVGQVATFTATYLVTQADLNNGSINDSATATGTPPSGPPVTSPPSTATVGVTQTPVITLTKSAVQTSYSAVGQTINYNYLVTNTGNVTLTSIGITDAHPGLAGLSCPKATLVPTGSETCTATYVVTQADLNAGSIINTATANGTPPTGPPITSNPSSVTIPAVVTATITLVKSAVQTTYSAVGQTINYNYLVTNTGNVTLSDITITDPHTGLTGLSCPDPTLAPAASETCTATYLVTQSDMSAGSIINTATANGTPPSGTPVTSQPSSVTIPETAITILKQVCGSSVPADCVAGGAGPWVSSADVAVGNSAYWRITVTNSGQTPLSGVTISDPIAPQCATTFGTISLAIGASDSIYCSSADVTSSFTNVASVTFTGQNTPPPSSSASVTAVVVTAAKVVTAGAVVTPPKVATAAAVTAPAVTG
jgi:uncharacterized repeat protein (TIGR01451 family)